MALSFLRSAAIPPSNPCRSSWSFGGTSYPSMSAWFVCACSSPRRWKANNVERHRPHKVRIAYFVVRPIIKVFQEPPTNDISHLFFVTISTRPPLQGKSVCGVKESTVRACSSPRCWQAKNIERHPPHRVRSSCHVELLTIKGVPGITFPVERHLPFYFFVSFFQPISPAHVHAL